ncbi:MAG: GAF and ANTAR domain-containing protein [Acidimicrobiales bacterium]
MATREELLADTFLQLADTLVDDFDVIELLTMLSGRCVELLDASATGILLADVHRTLHVVAASSEQVNLLELFQIQNEEGPCLDAFRAGVAVVHGDLGAQSPWPRFGRQAIEAGLPSVHAFPMRVRDTVLGTLNLFMAEAGPLSGADVTVAQALAHAATIALLQDRATTDTNRLTAQLQGALNSRVTIEQAKGALAERADIGMDEAFRRLRAYARDHSAKLTEVAETIVARTLAAAEMDILVSPGSPPTG